MGKLNFRHFVGILAAFALVFANITMSFANGGLGDSPNTSQESSEASTGAVSLKGKQDEFMKRIKTELSLSKTNYKEVLTTMNETKTRLDLVGEEELNLQQYLDNLDLNISVTKGKLDSVTEQIAEKQNQIAKIEEEVQIREVALEYQKQLLQDYLRLMYEQQNQYLTFGEDGEVDAFKLLLSDNSVSENVNQLQYYDMLSETGMQLAEKLDAMFEELQEKKDSLATENENLATLREETVKEKQELETQRDSKATLLLMTKGQEEIYNQLLEQTREQQGELLMDVKALNDALTFVERKIDQDGENFDPEKYESLLDYKTKSLYEFHLDSLGDSGQGLNWPVEPTRGISAYFRDSGYLGVFGVQHNAVDIPEYQGTPVHAAGDGVVYTAKDNGYGYSYIILAHAGGLMTVHGHMSEILVKEGDKILQGSIIGLSGGMPGTKGAGYMTTGPHLHFEVLKNGTHVDPLQYLPLTILSKSFAETMPEKYYDMWAEQIIAKGGEL